MHLHYVIRILKPLKLRLFDSVLINQMTREAYCVFVRDESPWPLRDAAEKENKAKRPAQRLPTFAFYILRACLYMPITILHEIAHHLHFT